LLIFILVDLFENLDKFIDKNLSNLLIFQYYIYFIPEILKLITPVGMLLATLFTTSRFNTYNEMTAIKSSGISIYRFSFPLMLFGIVITISSFYFNGWIVPKSNSEKLRIERTYLDKNRISGVIQNLHIQDSENLILALGVYNEWEKKASNVTLQYFDNMDLSKLIYRFDVKSMKWDSIKNEWKLFSIAERKFDSTFFERYSYIDSGYATEIAGIGKIYLSPSHIIKKQLKPDELLLTDLEDFIDSMEESGQNVSKAKVDYYSKISFPFANIVVILFGLSLSFGRRRSGAALQFGISILVTFIYLGFIKISQTFGYSGDINPILTAWLANITFFLIAAVNLLRVNFFWK